MVTQRSKSLGNVSQARRSTSGWSVLPEMPCCLVGWVRRLGACLLDSSVHSADVNWALVVRLALCWGLWVCRCILGVSCLLSLSLVCGVCVRVRAGIEEKQGGGPASLPDRFGYQLCHRSFENLGM